MREAHDHLGLKVNPAVVNHHSAANGFTNTDFPQVALHLVQTDWLEEEQPRSRTFPLLTTKDLLKKNKGLIVNLKFNNPNGSPADASFIIYLGYTDTWMKFKDKKFISPYRLYWREQPDPTPIFSFFLSLFLSISLFLYFSLSLSLCLFLIICVNMNWRKK
jgi:hypothetical protein